jgi:hypothetical protein
VLAEEEQENFAWVQGVVIFNEENEEDQVVFEVFLTPPPSNTSRMANSVHLSLSFSFCLAGIITISNLTLPGRE